MLGKASEKGSGGLATTKKSSVTTTEKASNGSTDKSNRPNKSNKSSKSNKSNAPKASNKKLVLRAAEIVDRLKSIYPDAVCALEFDGAPWKLMVMGRLSAQCTDKRVNEVCKILFEKFPTAEALAYGDIDEIREIVRPCGLFRVKSDDIKEECRMLVEDFGGVLPDTMDELLQFRGVGRKIANLLLGDIFHKGGIVADTHCIRICGRLGFYPEDVKDPLKTERIMSALMPPEEQSDFCHRIVTFGREYCKAQSPDCKSCPISELCSSKSKRI